jgi:predicted enzyme related to lactoylglutathione lyase
MINGIISKTKNVFLFLLLIVFSASPVLNACGIKNDESKNKIRFEHLALNVTDPVKTAEWYKENLGFKIVRQGGEPTFTTFISDEGGNMMFEFFHNADYPLQDFMKWDHNSIHMAFHCENIESIKNKLIENGATVASDIRKTDSGDQVLVLRDPWGFPIQFVSRVKKMLDHSGLYFEHLAFNLNDSREVAKWFKENLSMKIMRDGKAPTYGMFIADENANMMLELYQNKDYPVIDFENVSHMSIHLAFMVYNIEAAKEKVLSSGGKVVEDITKTSAGDFVLMMRTPWGLPIQFVKRSEPMLK